jgi:hypothetical protein
MKKDAKIFIAGPKGLVGSNRINHIEGLSRWPKQGEQESLSSIVFENKIKID